MTIDQAKDILGPIVAHYRIDLQCWTLHQKPSTILEIIREAESWQARRQTGAA